MTRKQEVRPLSNEKESVFPFLLKPSFERIQAVLHMPRMTHLPSGRRSQDMSWWHFCHPSEKQLFLLFSRSLGDLVQGASLCRRDPWCGHFNNITLKRPDAEGGTKSQMSWSVSCRNTIKPTELTLAPRTKSNRRCFLIVEKTLM